MVTDFLVVTLCPSLHDQGLDTLDSHESSLLLHGACVTMQCHEGSIDRLNQILQVWTHFLLMVSTLSYEIVPYLMLER